MKKNPTKSKVTEDFPKITIDVTISYLKKISNKAEGDVITYNEIGSSIGKAGGNLSRILSALKAFGLIDRAERHKEWKITNLGDKIIKKNLESDKLRAFLTPPIHTKIWEAYKQTKPSSGTLINYLKRGGFTQKPANKLTKLFLKSYEQFSEKAPLAISPKEEDGPQPKDIEENNKKVYLVYLLGSLFPFKIEDIEKTLSEIIKISKEKELHKLTTTAEFLKIHIKDMPKENIKKELSKFSEQVKKIMTEELGIENNK